MSGAGPVSPSLVLGRSAELARIDGWLRREPGPAGDDELTAVDTALVIEGEPGIGKTTLWLEAARGPADAGWQCCPAARLRPRPGCRTWPGRPAAHGAG